MKLINVIMLALAMLLITACSTTSNVVKDVDVATDATLKSLEVMVHSSDDVKVADYDEVELFITNGGFSPAVIVADAGQTIVVTSYYTGEDGVHFSIADLGVEEVLDEAESFSFTPKEKGEYPYICLDCSPMLKGVLVVE